MSLEFLLQLMNQYTCEMRDDDNTKCENVGVWRLLYNGSPCQSVVVCEFHKVLIMRAIGRSPVMLDCERIE